MKWILISFIVLVNSTLFAQVLPSFRWAKTTGRLPYLEYGPGDDRLGGAKMTYLDSLVLLKVVDSLNGDYIVQLSHNHRAFISRENITWVDERQSPAYSLSGSFKVYGDDQYDYVHINLQEKLPYRSIMQISPSLIVLDIFGATSNTNWVTQLNTAKEIRNTWYEQTEDDVLRVFIELKHEQHWGHRVYYDTTGNKLIVKVKHQPTIKDIRKLHIAIDAGHGGINSGATGLNSKVLEKDYTLLMAKELEKQLRKAGNKNIYMTRTTDTTLDMPERILALREQAPDILISIHLNSSSKDSIQGTSTYYRYIGFRPLSQAILSSMLKLNLKEFGNIGHFNFALSGPTEYPNSLVEVAFLSNASDEKRIIDPKFHKLVAKKIIEGTKDWLKNLK
jgi:N-acetylmuramoyl-L-alanine amidase